MMVFAKTFLLIIVSLVLAAVYGLQRSSSFQRSGLQIKQPRLCDAKKDAAREEQWKIQQEMLARRKNKPEMQKLFSSVEERRKATWAKASELNYARDTKNSVDPLAKFKQNQAAGKVAPLGYEAPPPTRKGGFSLPFPANPIGIEKYDEGLRFDLRLPYAERGYEDPDADVMAKAGSFFSGLLGGGKKPAAKKVEEVVEPPPPPPKKKNWPF